MSDSKRQAIERRVREIIGTTFGISGAAIEGDLRMGDPASWDSMGHMQLIASLEEACGWSCPTHRIADLVDLRSLVDEIAGTSA